MLAKVVCDWGGTVDLSPIRGGAGGQMLARRRVQTNIFAGYRLEKKGKPERLI
jgi:hypothetical protein